MSDIWLPWNPFHFFHSRKVAKKRIDDLVPIVLTSRPSLPALPARRHCREKCHVDGENDVNGSLPNYDRDVHSTQATCVWVSRMKHFLIFSWQIEATKASCNVCFVWDMSKLWRTSTTGFPTEDHALLVIYWTSAGIQHCWKSRCCLLQWLNSSLLAYSECPSHIPQRLSLHDWRALKKAHGFVSEETSRRGWVEFVSEEAKKRKGAEPILTLTCAPRLLPPAGVDILRCDQRQYLRTFTYTIQVQREGSMSINRDSTRRRGRETRLERYIFQTKGARCLKKV